MFYNPLNQKLLAPALLLAQIKDYLITCPLQLPAQDSLVLANALVLALARAVVLAQAALVLLGALAMLALARVLLAILALACVPDLAKAALARALARALILDPVANYQAALGPVPGCLAKVVPPLVLVLVLPFEPAVCAFSKPLPVANVCPKMRLYP